MSTSIRSKCFRSLAFLVAASTATWSQQHAHIDDGYLTFTNENPSLYYRIEFTPNLTGTEEWDGTYRSLRNIHSAEPEITVPIGVFYRVVGRAEPYVTGTATAGNILTGRTAYVNDAEVKGTMPNVGTVDFFPQSAAQTIPQGYHSGKGEVAGDTNLVEHNVRSGTTLFGIAGVLEQATGKATPAQVLDSRTFSNDEGPAIGTMSHQSGHVTAQSVTRNETTLRFRPPMGYYAGTAANSVQFSDPDFVAENVKYGVNLFALPGAYPSAAVVMTGQTLSFAVGDDAWWHTNEVGVAWPAPRFTDHDDGTVTDHLTRLMWVKDADLPGGRLTWDAALDFCNAMNAGVGTYGYTDWRLPNICELNSLIDYGQHTPPLPAGHPFSNVETFFYFSSSTQAISTNSAWGQEMTAGAVFFLTKANECSVWPVRGGMR